MLSTILIVDGDSAQCQAAKRAISEKLKYNTIAVENGQEAVDLLLSADSVADLMLLDARPEKIDALYVIRSIRQYRKDFPIIILTEYGNHAYAAEAIHAGANDFLTKPVVIERLGLSIASALRVYHLCEMVKKLERQLAEEVSSTSLLTSFSAFNSMSSGGDGNVKKLRTLEENAIRFALNACGGSMSKAARSLGIGRSTLYRKVGEMGRHRGVKHYISRENQTTRPIIEISEMEHS